MSETKALDPTRDVHALKLLTQGTKNPRGIPSAIFIVIFEYIFCI